MRRGDFLKEMADGLFQTVKSVYEPFLSGDLEKVEAAAERALGITWHPLMKEHELDVDIEMKFFNGKPLIISRYETSIQAINGVCPVCSNIIILSTLFSTGKCLNCQKEYDFKIQSGDLQLVSYPIKRKNGTYLIGIAKHRKQGESDA